MPAVVRQAANLLRRASGRAPCLRHRWQSGPPAPPATCCGDGCPRCVWDIYYEELAAYEKRQKPGSVQTPPVTFDVVRHFQAPSLETAEDLYAARRIAMVPIVSARCLTRDGHRRPVLEVQLDIRPLGQSYKPGDHLLIHAPNPPDLVDQLVRRLGYPPESKLEIRTTSPGARGPDWQLSGFMTAAHLFSHYVDISSPGVLGNSGLLQVLEAHCADPRERERLQRCVAEPRSLPPPCTHSLLSLLEAFPSCTPPLPAVLSWLKPLLPRCFSASSSPLLSPETLAITFTVCGDLHSSVPLRDRVGGLCTSWMQTCLANPEGPGVLAAAWPKKRPRVFTLPEDPQQPIILCAAGSGIGPIKAMLDHRAALLESGVALGRCRLFYGCATEEDVLYGDDLSRWLAMGVLTDLQLALSHRGELGASQYVWHRLLQHGPALLREMDEGAVFYVCGSPEMQRDVATTWETIAQQQQRAGPILEGLQAVGRYRVELWT